MASAASRPPDHRSAVRKELPHLPLLPSLQTPREPPQAPKSTLELAASRARKHGQLTGIHDGPAARLAKQEAHQFFENGKIVLSSLQHASAVRDIVRAEEERRSKLRSDIMTQLHADAKHAILQPWCSTIAGTPGPGLLRLDARDDPGAAATPSSARLPLRSVAGGLEAGGEQAAAPLLGGQPPWAAGQQPCCWTVTACDPGGGPQAPQAPQAAKGPAGRPPEVHLPSVPRGTPRPLPIRGDAGRPYVPQAPALACSQEQAAATAAAADAADEPLSMPRSLPLIPTTQRASKSRAKQQDSASTLLPSSWDRDSDEDENLEELHAKADQEAAEQTLSSHFVLMVAEKQIMEVAVAAARTDVRIDEEEVGRIKSGSSDKKRTSLVRKTKGHAETMVSFLPNTMCRCIRHSLVNLNQRKVLLQSPVNSWYDPVLSRFPAAVVFADASGFTKLTERLANEPHGAELIGETLNRWFKPLINIIHKHHGDVVKFSGDAMTIIWAAAEPAPRRGSNEGRFGHSQLGSIAAVSAAARCCLEMQEIIPEIGQTKISGCSLSMHTGVGFGNLALLQLGGLLSRWEFCVAGQALDQIAIAEPLAGSGETVFSPEACSLIADRFVFEDMPTSNENAKGFKKLIRAKGDEEDPIFDWWKIEPAEHLDLDLVKRYIPTAVARRLACSPDAETVTYPEEMRRLSVVFLSIPGLDPSSATPRDQHTKLSGGREAQLLMRLMQCSVYALEGSVNKFLVDDKGALLLIVFGLPPLIHFTDDPLRAVLCGMRLCHTLRDEGLYGRVGVATGECWCGVIGSAECREYTVLGDVVNLSARLMTSAPHNGVLADAETHRASSRVLQFEDGGELHLKGKEKPTRIFRFVGTRRGLARHRKELQVPLLTWDNWPARLKLVRALNVHEEQSGTIYIRGPGGVGKTELAEEVRTWAAAKGWTLLSGQNMEPTGIFALPRLCLQELFRELVNVAIKDDFWRSEGWKLLLASVKGDSQSPVPGDFPQPLDDRDSLAPSDLQQRRHGPPTHSELYWILVAMIRKSLGPEAASLEPWAPLLGLVVTQLSFAPSMVAAMLERDEQHGRHNRFAQVCSAVLDGFAKHSAAARGTLVLLHFRNSSAVFQSRDDKESAAIYSFMELCKVRRQPEGAQHEAKPLLLCVVSRGDALKDDELLAHGAQETGGLLNVDDLGRESTQAFVEHSLQYFQPEAEAYKGNVRQRKVTRGWSSHSQMKNSPANSATPIPASSSPGPNLAVPQAPIPDIESVTVHDTDLLAQYVHEMTGGNIQGVLTVLESMEHQKVLVPVKIPSGTITLRLTEACEDIAWLRSSVQPPQSMVAMAFSRFEQLTPKEQMILKVASTFTHDFSLWDLKVSLTDTTATELLDICKKLSSSNSRTLRKVKPGQIDRQTSSRSTSRRPSWTPTLGKLDSHSALGTPTLGKLDSHSSLGTPTQLGKLHSPMGSMGTSRRQSVAMGASALSVKEATTGRRGSRLVALEDERFQFYSLLLKHVASTLVLESQRSEMQRKRVTINFTGETIEASDESSSESSDYAGSFIDFES